MYTNFKMLRDLLEVYHPQTRGIVTAVEIQTITKMLHLNDMDVLQLRNMRDFTVLYLSKSETMEDWDRMSAITSVIDTIIWNKGGEV